MNNEAQNIANPNIKQYIRREKRTAKNGETKVYEYPATYDNSLRRKKPEEYMPKGRPKTAKGKICDALETLDEKATADILKLINDYINTHKKFDIVYADEPALMQPIAQPIAQN